MNNQYYNRPSETFDGIIISTEKGNTKHIRDVMHILVGFLFVLFLGALFYAVHAIAGILPDPVMTTKSQGFVTKRAYENLKALTDLGPRVTGQIENEQWAVDYLETEITDIISQANKALKMELDVQLVSGMYGTFYINSYANLQNVVVKLYGTNSTNSLLVNSHFDSAPTSPGASDNGINVVAMLEVLRVLSQKDVRPTHNIIFLFNGAEEVNRLGSHAFITKHRWAKECKVVINVDSCGLGGKIILFQTGPKSPWLLKYYSAVPHPYGMAIGEELFQMNLVPSATDFKIFQHFGGLIGFDMAFFKNGYVYHTMFDDISTLPLGSLQNVGDNVLSLVSNLADAEEIENTPNEFREDVVYFDVFGLFLIHYRIQTGMIINIITVAFSMGMFLKCLRDCRFDCDSKTSKYLGLTFGAVIGGWTCAILFVVIIAVILDSSSYCMSWYTQTWLIFGLYVVPTIALSGIFLTFLDTRDLTISEQVEMEVSVVRVIWTVCLFLATIFYVRSAYIIMIPVLLNTIIFVIIAFLRIKFSGEHWYIVYIVMYIIPTMFLMYLANEIMSFIIPITGRLGPSHNADLIIGISASVMTILITSLFVPLIRLLRRSRWFLVIISIFFVAAFIIVFTPLGFPYTVDSQHRTPQRYWTMHIERMNYSVYNQSVKNDSGYFVLDMDRNSPKFLQEYIPQFRNANRIEKDCEKYPLCGLPFTPTSSILQYSKWLPADSPNVENKPALTVNHINSSNDGILTYNVSVKGPSNLMVYLSPKSNISLIRANLDDAPNAPHTEPFNRFCIIKHISGKYIKPLNFTFDLQTAGDRSFSQVVDIVVIGIYPNISTTAHYDMFIDSFPKWTIVTPYVAIYCLWTL